MSDEEMITKIFTSIVSTTSGSLDFLLEKTDETFNHLKDTIKLRDNNRPLVHEIISKRNKNEV